MKVLNWHREVGKRVYAVRIDAGFTQESLAEAMKISARHVQFVESGQRRPSLDFLIAMALLCKVRPGVFLDFLPTIDEEPTDLLPLPALDQVAAEPVKTYRRMSTRKKPSSG